jgi:hypothetical protein
VPGPALTIERRRALQMLAESKICGPVILFGSSRPAAELIWTSPDGPSTI